MKSGFVLSISLSVLLEVAAQAQAHPPHSPRIVEGYGKLPLAFEVNQGQSDPQVKFLSRGAGYSLFLTADAAVLALQPSARSPLGAGQAKNRHPQSARAVLRMKLVNASPNTAVSGQAELPGKSNYFIGNNPKKWRTNVRQFAKVRYQDIYPGIDLVYYGHQRELEYDFVLQPGASPKAIRLGIVGARNLRLDHRDLVMTTGVGDVHLRAPRIYQEANGGRQEVRGGYVIKSTNEVGLEIAAYDPRQALVIDPVLAYATYLGGSLDEGGAGIAVDSAGNAYVTGTTTSVDFPTSNAIQPTHGANGGDDAFVTKINSEGTALVYSTYLGGSAADGGSGIAVDSNGNAYVTGFTQSTDFPIANALQATRHGSDSSDAFVTKINAHGNGLVYSTYIGGAGNDRGSDIAVDSTGNAYLSGTTNSTNFPTKNAIQTAYGGGNWDVFVSKINAAGSALVYSTYLGGSLSEESAAVAVDSAGCAYVTGYTQSTNFPTKNAIQQTNHGGPTGNDADAFVTKINAAGSALVYSTYLGGDDFDGGNGIAADSTGNAYVTGVTFSTDFPTINAIQPSLPVGSHGFVAKIKADGSAFAYSTYLGGSGGILAEFGSGIAVDTSGNAYVIGQTSSSDFPTVNAIQPSLRGESNAFITKINASGTAFLYSTYFGGFIDVGNRIALDVARSAYLVGGTGSYDFPKTLLAFQTSLKPQSDAFIAKIASKTFVHLSPQKIIFDTQVIGTTSAPKKLSLTNQGSGTLTINRIFLGYLDPGDFAQTNTCGATLPPSASCTISVTFTPMAKNRRPAALGVSDRDPASPQAVALGGAGTVVSFSKAKLSFGDQAVGTSSSQSVTLTNTGSTQLNFGDIYILGTSHGDFSQMNTCGTSIAAKASCTIAITFKPTATGIRTAALYVRDDGGGSPQKVNLAGTGT